MYEWNDQQQMIRLAVREFCEKEIAPNLAELEHGETPPYEILRKLVRTFGLDHMARERFRKRMDAAERPEEAESAGVDAGEGDILRSDVAAMAMIPIIELCRYSPGMVTAMGVSMGLTSGAIMNKGTLRQQKRWALDLLTLDKIGAWAITEPDSGSDAFGRMRSIARRDGDEYILNGSKTFITNGPYADTIVFICKLDDGAAPADRKILHFVLDSGMEGLDQSKPLAKMGLHSSPTGELFLSDVRCGVDRLLGETEDVPPSAGKAATKASFLMERTGVAAMALGIIERCLEKCGDYAKARVTFGKPIGEYQLIQLKLAKMEVARVNIQNLVWRQIEMASAGKSMTLAEASACKLYSAQAAVEVAMEAVQLHGGNGYMAEYEVEQLARDAKVLQIYGGTDEIQISQIARELLA